MSTSHDQLITTSDSGNYGFPYSNFTFLNKTCFMLMLAGSLILVQIFGEIRVNTQIISHGCKFKPVAHNLYDYLALEPVIMSVITLARFILSDTTV